MKNVTFTIAIAFIFGCMSCTEDSNLNDTNNGSMESPTKGIPTGTGIGDSARDHTDVNKDTLHP
jgi:hypothetical protein